MSNARRLARGLAPMLIGSALGLAPFAGAVAAQAIAQQAAPKPAATPAAASKSAAAPAAPGAKDKKGAPVPGFGSNSKEPIQIESDKLEVFSKEQRAVYTGNVVAVQGDTTIKAPTMIVFYDRQGDKTDKPAADKAATEKPTTEKPTTEKPAATASDAAAKPAADDAPAENSGTSLRRVEAKGGVSVVSKDQVATGNEGVFDRASNKIILTGNVALSQGENVTKGQKLVYDTETGVAIVESGPGASTPGGRVRGVFVPGNDDKAGDKKGKTDSKTDSKSKTPGKPQG